jgi:amino acid transporter
MSGLALLVVLGCLNANVFVTPRVVFGLSRDGLGPRALSRVSAGGTPWTATLLVGAVALGLAASGTFERLLALSITFVLVIDGSMVLVLFRLRKRDPRAPFETPFYPAVPLAFLTVYALLLAGAAWQQPGVTAVAALALSVTWGIGALVSRYSATA